MESVIRRGAPTGGNGRQSTFWAVVPVKPLNEGKARLASVLSPVIRADLMRILLGHLLEVLSETSGLDGILVVSRDKEVMQIAQASGAVALEEDGAAGLNAAVTRAIRWLSARGVTAAVVLPADIPFAQATDVERLLTAYTPAGERGRRGPGNVVICPDDKGDGTNALLLSLPAPGFDFKYGPGSFDGHLREADRLGLSADIVKLPGLAFDLDTEADWRRYVHAAGDPFQDRSPAHLSACT